jgi:hypothetical protein
VPLNFKVLDGTVTEEGGAEGIVIGKECQIKRLYYIYADVCSCACSFIILP